MTPREMGLHQRQIEEKTLEHNLKNGGRRENQKCPRRNVVELGDKRSPRPKIEKKGDVDHTAKSRLGGL